MRRLALGLALLAITSSVNWPASAQTGSTIADADSYAVYSALLPSGPVALLEETRGASACPNADQLTSPWKELHDSYQAANATIHALVPQMFPRPSIEFVSVETLQGLLGAVNAEPGVISGHHAAFRAFPGERLFVVSAIGFNAERTVAMVAVQQNCVVSANGEWGGCNSGKTTVAQKDQNGWREIRPTTYTPLMCMWIS